MGNDDAVIALGNNLGYCFLAFGINTIGYKGIYLVTQFLTLGYAAIQELLGMVACGQISYDSDLFDCLAAGTTRGLVAAAASRKGQRYQHTHEYR